MKFKRVVIEGFRGIPKALELELDGKSLCLLGENGRGKTSIVDALQLWSLGKVEGFTREGYGLDATVNLDHGGPAIVTCERQGHATLRRSLSGSRASQLELAGPSSLDSSLPPALPILRHRTMAEFMSDSPGEKKRSLLSLLGLGGLLEFRDQVNKAANVAEKRATDAQVRLVEEERGLAREQDGLATLERAEQLRVEAGLDVAIGSEHELLTLDFGAIPAISQRVDRAALVDAVARLATSPTHDVVGDWNTAVADQAARTAEAVSALLTAGGRVLEEWLDPTCPLCLQTIDRAELASNVKARAKALEASRERIRAAGARTKAEGVRLESLAAALETALGSPPSDGWPAAETAIEAVRQFRATGNAIAAGVAGHRNLGELNLPEIDDLLISWRESAVEKSVAPTAAALARLERLRMSLERVGTHRVAASASAQVASSMERFRGLVELFVKRLVEDAVADVASVVADYYGRLVKNPAYSDVSLDYRDDRAGGVEFSLRFDKRFDVTPPQRVVSESQLNALGLAFFLARLRVEKGKWRALVLDDVVNSFDSDHRMGLARLLSEEFADWQVLLFTHDSVFATLSERFFVGWRFWQIVGWTPREGPILSEGDPLKRLEARLDAGETALDLGGLARFALERGLSRPVERLGLPIRFDRRALHAAPEYLEALEKGLSDRGSALKDAPVLSRMRGESYLSNVGAHDRQADPSLSTEDVRQLVADLHELAGVFTCSGCGRPVWEARKGRDHFQCACSKLAV